MSAATSLNLFQRINQVRTKVDYAQKLKSIDGKFKVVTHDQITALVRQHMIDAGIVCYPEMIASFSEPKAADAKMFRYEATYAFHFVNMDAPDDRLTIVIQSHAMDNSDKAPGKAISYAKKYALLKLFEIETGEEEESSFKDVDVFDLLTWSEKIDAATDKAVIQYLYLEAKKDAVRLNDAPSLKTLGQHVKKVLEAKFPEVAK